MISVLWVSPAWIGGTAKGENGRCLCLAFVLEAQPAWNTAQGKFPDREICRLHGPGGRLGLRLFSYCSWEEGLGFSEQGWGRQPAFLVVAKEPAL